MSNIQSEFEDTGIWLLNVDKPITVGVRESKYSEKMINLAHLLNLTEEKFNNTDNFFNQEVSVVSGFVDKKCGL